MIIDRQTFIYQGKVLIEKVVIQPPFRYEVIFQNEGCFIYVKGAITKLLASEEKMQLRDKEAVLLKCGTYFVDFLRKTEDKNMEVIAFHFYPEILKKLYQNELPKTLKKNNSSNQIQKIIPADTISKFVDSLSFYFQNPAVVNEDLLEIKIKELIILLIQTGNSVSILEIIANLFTPSSTNLKKIIDLHLFENLAIQELAKLCNLSASSFKRKFNIVFNDSPLNYINTKKIEKAKELLEISDLSISEISFKIGFNDPLYFTRQFKKKIGVPPSFYRNEMKQ